MLEREFARAQVHVSFRAWNALRRFSRPHGPMLLLLAGVTLLSPDMSHAQYLGISPDEIYAGDCYSVSGWAPYINLDVAFSIDGQGTFEVADFASLDDTGSAMLCTNEATPTGLYEFTGVRESGTAFYWGISTRLRIRPLPASHPQPTSLSFSAASGYAGNDGYTMTVGNGSGMTIEVEYTINGGTPDFWSTTLDGNGQWSYNLNHYDRPGTYHFYKIKNLLNNEWVDVDASYTVLPPQPTGILIDPQSGTAGQSNWNIRVANGAEMSIDVRYTVNSTPLPDILNWLWLDAVAPFDAAGAAYSVPLPVCVTPGFYRFTHVRNHLNGDESQWVSTTGANFMMVQPPDAPALTSAAPLSGFPGTSVAVTLEGENLCGVSLSTDYPGLSFNTIPTDLSSSGTSVIAVFNVAANAATGPATVNLTANGGTTSLVFHVGGEPVPAVLSREYIYLGNSLLAVESQ